jgi:hypothetical protein
MSEGAEEAVIESSTGYEGYLVYEVNA